MPKRRARKEAKTTGRTRRAAKGRPAGDRNPSRTGEFGEGKKENALVEWLRTLLLAIVLFFLITTFLVKTSVVISGSMEDTLLVGDLLLVDGASVGSRIPGVSLRIPGYAQPRRGQVFVLDPPHGPVCPPGREKASVSRAGRVQSPLR